MDQESIKNVFVLIGIGALIYAAITMLPPYYNREKYQSACADAFGHFDYKWIYEKLYCKTHSGEWARHPDPPTPTRYNVWGQSLEEQAVTSDQAFNDNIDSLLDKYAPVEENDPLGIRSKEEKPVSEMTDEELLNF